MQTIGVWIIEVPDNQIYPFTRDTICNENVMGKILLSNCKIHTTKIPFLLIFEGYLGRSLNMEWRFWKFQSTLD